MQSVIAAPILFFISHMATRRQCRRLKISKIAMQCVLVYLCDFHWRSCVRRLLLFFFVCVFFLALRCRTAPPAC